MERIDIAGIALETEIAGTGPPLLFLHGGDYVAQNRPFLDRLARAFPGHRAAPSGVRPYAAPGTGSAASTTSPISISTCSTASTCVTTVLVGSSLGGWIALEMAVRVARADRPARADRLASGSSSAAARSATSPISTPCRPTRCCAAPSLDPARARARLRTLDDGEALAIARDREATSLYGWKPYMHDPGAGALAAPDHRPGAGAVGRAGRHRRALLWRAPRRRLAERQLRADRSGGALPADRTARRGRRRDRTLRRQPTNAVIPA